MGKHEEYDWLDDPFDEKKAAAERERTKMGFGSKIAVVAILAIVVIFALVILAALALITVVSA